MEVKEPSTINTAHLVGKFCFNVYNNKKWIVDSGTSDHICLNLNSFINYTKVEGKPQFVTIPNRIQFRVEIIGTVRLDNGVILKNILYVPRFYFNLISVSKLI